MFQIKIQIYLLVFLKTVSSVRSLSIMFKPFYLINGDKSGGSLHGFPIILRHAVAEWINPFMPLTEM